MASYDVVVIGGGNLGLWTSYHLAQQNFGRVAVCDSGWVGGGATIRSAGNVRQQGGYETGTKLGKLSREMYLELGAELGLDSGFVQTGYCVVAETEEQKTLYLELLEMRRGLGVDNEWIDPDEGRRRLPGLNWDRLLGATYTHTDGYVHPPIVIRNVTHGILRKGTVDLLEMCEVQNIDHRGDHYLLETTRGLFEAERVVNAAGPLGAREIGAMIGVEIPVMAVRHQVVTFPTVRQSFPHSFPICLALRGGFYVRPEEEGALLGLNNPQDEADTSGRFQLDFDWDFYAKSRPDWESLFPMLKGQQISRAWAACVDFIPDHLPVIDEPRAGFYMLAASSYGMTNGPALGAKMAELIVKGEVSDLPDADIKLSRFTADYGGEPSTDALALPFSGS